MNLSSFLAGSVPLNCQNQAKVTTTLTPPKTQTNAPYLTYQSNQIINGSSCQNSFRKTCLDMHNTFRAIHRVPSVTQNLTVLMVADKYAKYLADFNLFQHSQTSGLGENLAYTWSTQNQDMNNCSCK